MCIARSGCWPVAGGWLVAAWLLPGCRLVAACLKINETITKVRVDAQACGHAGAYRRMDRKVNDDCPTDKLNLKI